MGYTHYFRIKPGDRTRERWPELAADARRLLALPGAPTTTGVDIGDAAIIFDAPGSETFLLNRAGMRLGTGDWFCKTGNAPVDELVCAILLRAKHHLGDELIVGSDGQGGYPGSWADGQVLCQRLWPHDDLPTAEVLFAGEVLTDDDLDDLAGRRS